MMVSGLPMSPRSLSPPPRAFSPPPRAPPPPLLKQEVPDVCPRGSNGSKVEVVREVREALLPALPFPARIPPHASPHRRLAVTDAGARGDRCQLSVS
jgi:hypothetical protein